MNSTAKLQEPLNPPHVFFCMPCSFHTCHPRPPPPPPSNAYLPSLVHPSPPPPPFLEPPSVLSSSMAERQPGSGPSPGPALPTRPRRPLSTSSSAGALLRRLRDYAPNSSQLVGFLTLIVSGCILLLLTGITLTGAVMALIFFGPLVLLTSPIWVPAGLVMFAAAAVVLSACGFGVAALAGASWLYRYFMGRHPSGADARSRIAGAASHLKDYTTEYGGYLKGRVKDAAPGA